MGQENPETLSRFSTTWLGRPLLGFAQRSSFAKPSMGRKGPVSDSVASDFDGGRPKKVSAGARALKSMAVYKKTKRPGPPLSLDNTDGPRRTADRGRKRHERETSGRRVQEKPRIKETRGGYWCSTVRGLVQEENGRFSLGVSPRSANKRKRRG